ncbi:hypothetical protein GN157_10390 [Flavobacterium rakeshii]|uniref:Pentapeptide repeat-containing protein n=1 Tax=Flavobacterium rakeshii TaxID=1038845 RepID=A0A6N8HE92_9FLAO|nr:pentapeptide repeat-containing protein [Flavobacterium rakeshii]MUV04116.1 hypothetical protein [Flavobacterium rakeshii]
MRTVFKLLLILICLLILFYLASSSEFFLQKFENFALWLYPLNKDRNAELFKIILTVIGGLGVLYSLHLSYRRAVTTEKGIDLQGKAINKQSEQLELSRKSQIDERFKNAIEHLGSEKEPIILGGVAELHQIAKENSKDYSEVVLNILLSYVRSIATVKLNSEDRNITIIQTIINYVFKDKDKSPYEGLFGNLSYTNFKYIDINGIDLSKFNLKHCIFPMEIQNVDLSEADLSYTVFQSSVIKGVNFESSKFYNSNFMFVEISDSNFKNADLNSSHLIHCKLSNSSLSCMEIYKTEFLLSYFEEMNFIEVDLLKVSFFGSSFKNCLFRGNKSMLEIDFRACGFTDFNIENLCIRGDFRGCHKMDSLNSIFRPLDSLDELVNYETNSNELIFLNSINFIESICGKLSLEDINEFKKIYEDLMKNLKDKLL